MINLDLDIDVTFIDSFFNEEGYINSLGQTISENRSEDSDFLLYDLCHASMTSLYYECHASTISYVFQCLTAFFTN